MEKKPPVSPSEFADEINIVKEAEDRYVRDIEEAKKKKEDRIKQAQARAHETAQKAERDGESLKARIVEEGKRKIAEEERAILSKAEQEVQALRKVRFDENLPAQLAARLAKDVVSGA